MILTGYSPDAVYVIDSYSGMHQVFSLDTFLTSWSVLGNQAVIYPGESLPVPAQERLEGETYIVQPGDYLNGLALQFSLSWQDLAEWNRLDSPYTIYAGQTLLVSKPQNNSSPIAEGDMLVEPPSSMPLVHTVAAGDTLLEIAAQYTTTWEELVAINGMLYPYFIYPAQTLQLPQNSQPAEPGAEQPASTESGPASTAPETYTVQPGDGLMEIARQLDLDWLVLAELNGIEDPYILYPGRILLLR
jgi:LysM repeat protein